MPDIGQATETPPRKARLAVAQATRWLASNIALAAAYVYALAVGSSLVSKGMVDAVGQAAFTLWFAWLATPAFIVVLGGIWAASRALGHPRTVSVLAWSGLGLAAGLGTQTNALAWVLIAAGYGAAMVLPGKSIMAWPSGVRGLVVGLAFGTVWLVGPIAAVMLAIWRGRSGHVREAAATALAATAPAIVLVGSDLLRPDVPITNYLFVGALGLIAAIAIWFLVGGGATRSGRRPAISE